MKDVRRKDQRKSEAPGNFQRIGTKAEATEHRIAARFTDTQDDALEPFRPVDRFERDAQHVVQLEFADQGIAHVLNAGQQNHFAEPAAVCREQLQRPLGHLIVRCRRRRNTSKSTVPFNPSLLGVASTIDEPLLAPPQALSCLPKRVSCRFR
jgi:hypothetical protein